MSRRADGNWTVAAESPARSAVDLAIGAMAQTVTARGGDLITELWGPAEGFPASWQHYGRKEYSSEAAAAPAADDGIAPTLSAREEREFDRRIQTLSAALGRANLSVTPVEIATVARPLDADGIRLVSQWLGSTTAARR
ncbi:hypothetical protein ACIA8E_38215 [Streptomyces sp. NPDC051664]|uniref:hypothetical protein n=1 Tax=Streptomyces sp. NPDC051664 TaxID=3365668 RepID=UPI0037A72F38